MTLMPVSNISVVGVRSSTRGASWWMPRRSTSSGSGSPRSIGSPSRLKMRPSVTSPTGTVIGPPVSITSMPRARPSVVSIATARTRSSPRCCWTSQTSSASSAPALIPGGLLLAVRRGALDRDRVVDLGQAVGEDGLDHDALDLLDAPDVAAAVLGGVRLGCGAGHLVVLSFFLSSLVRVVRLAEALGPGHDLHDLLGDLGLAGAVHLQRVVGDQISRRCRRRCASRSSARRRSPRWTPPARGRSRSRCSRGRAA